MLGILTTELFLMTLTSLFTVFHTRDLTIISLRKNRIILLVLLYQDTFLIIHCYLGIGILCCLVLVCKAHFLCVKLFLFCSVLPILGTNLINVIMPKTTSLGKVGLALSSNTAHTHALSMFKAE